MLASLIQDVISKILEKYVEELKKEDMEIDVILAINILLAH